MAHSVDNDVVEEGESVPFPDDDRRPHDHRPQRERKTTKELLNWSRNFDSVPSEKGPDC
jgi:hypothetical protein